MISELARSRHSMGGAQSHSTRIRARFTTTLRVRADWDHFGHAQRGNAVGARSDRDLGLEHWRAGREAERGALTEAEMVAALGRDCRTRADSGHVLVMQADAIIPDRRPGRDPLARNSTSRVGTRKFATSSAAGAAPQSTGSWKSASGPAEVP